MKNEQAREISALIDGELEAHEVRAAIKASLNDADRWRIYGLIGDGLRGETFDAPDMTASVMSRICEEPVVLAPHWRRPLQGWRWSDGWRWRAIPRRRWPSSICWCPNSPE